MSGTDNLESIPFGCLPFDLFVMERWDASSPMSKKEQKKALVTEWIELGQHGRKVYLCRCQGGDFDKPGDIIPTDLLTPIERAFDGGGISMYWIRTWYGTGDSQLSSGPAGSKTTSVSRESADAAYSRLWRKVFLADSDDENAEYDGYSVIDKGFIFDDNETDFGVIQQDKDEEVARVGELPPFVLAVLLSSPDELDGLTLQFRDEEESEPDKEVDRHQKMLFMVADREACEDGWILQIAINHKGKVLPKRIRSIARNTDLYVGQWVSGATPIDLEREPEEIVVYIGAEAGWEGWD